VATGGPAGRPVPPRGVCPRRLLPPAPQRRWRQARPVRGRHRPAGHRLGRGRGGGGGRHSAPATAASRAAGGPARLRRRGAATSGLTAGRSRRARRRRPRGRRRGRRGGPPARGGGARCGAGGPQLSGPGSRPARRQRAGAAPPLWRAGTPLAPPPPRPDHGGHAPAYHRPVGRGRAGGPRQGLGQPGPRHRQAGSRDAAVGGAPRPARPRPAGGGNAPAHVSLGFGGSVPRPLADRAGPPGGHAAARRAPRGWGWWGAPPPPASVGTVGGPWLDGGGRHDRGASHRLLGAALPSDVWALASGAPARGWCRRPRTGRPPAAHGVGAGAWAQGRAGASASVGGSHPPGSPPATAASRRIERTLKVKSNAPGGAGGARAGV